MTRIYCSRCKKFTKESEHLEFEVKGKHIHADLCRECYEEFSAAAAEFCGKEIPKYDPRKSD